MKDELIGNGMDTKLPAYGVHPDDDGNLLLVTNVPFFNPFSHLKSFYSLLKLFFSSFMTRVGSKH